MTPLRCLFAATVLMLTALPVHANSFLPGEDKAPSVISTDPGIVSLATDHYHGTFNLSGGGKTLIGTIDEYVLVDPFNLIPSCPGCLDFAFVVSIDGTSTGSMLTFGFGDTTGLITNINYVVEPGGVAPNFANRLPLGLPINAVGWRFTSFLNAGQTSDFLLVGTNATTYNRSGVASLNEDGSTFSTGAPKGFIFDGVLQPPAAVPEPSSILLLSTAGLGIAVAFRRRIG